MLFQSMQRGSEQVTPLKDDYPFEEVSIFDDPNYPLMYFVEKRYAHDPTNWWIPNQAAAEAMLRSSGFQIIAHPEQEVYLCRSAALPDDMPRAVYPSRFGGDKA